jgi:hypothetical protein
MSRSVSSVPQPEALAEQTKPALLALQALPSDVTKLVERLHPSRMLMGGCPYVHVRVLAPLYGMCTEQAANHCNVVFHVCNCLYSWWMGSRDIDCQKC